MVLSHRPSPSLESLVILSPIICLPRLCFPLTSYIPFVSNAFSLLFSLYPVPSLNRCINNRSGRKRKELPRRSAQTPLHHSLSVYHPPPLGLVNPFDQVIRSFHNHLYLPPFTLPTASNPFYRRCTRCCFPQFLQSWS